MSREAPFRGLLECIDCGNKGSFDFGDYGLCTFCLQGDEPIPEGMLRSRARRLLVDGLNFAVPGSRWDDEVRRFLVLTEHPEENQPEDGED